jgi:tocopherol O-methyltransferase
MINEKLKKEIINYYDKCQVNYQRWWDLDRSLAMHAGFWDGKAKNLSQALLRENEVLAEIASIKSGERVLDAGCGVGGSSIYLAQTLGCRVTGITLSPKQVEMATARVSGLKNPPEFLVMDYTDTTFPDGTFDVVWAIESVCHAENKRDFLHEAWRILKPGGRLILADGFHVKNEYSAEERELLAKAVNGWAVNSMESIPNFEKYLKEEKFVGIEKIDATEWVIPSSRKLFFYSFPAIAWSKLGEYFGWSTKTQTRDFLSYHFQFWAVRKGLCKYMIFFAKKMNSSP